MYVCTTWADVIAGLFLGATFAVVCLLRAIPSLRRATCDPKPYTLNEQMLGHTL